MQTTNWNPQEAGKQANARDQKHAQQLEQQRSEDQKARAYATNRKQRAHSVVRPAIYPIKRKAIEICAVFNNELTSKVPHDKAIVYEDFGGLGLHNILSAFAIIYGFKRIELIPNYEKWEISLLSDKQVIKVYEVDDEVVDGARKTFYKNGNDRISPEEIAYVACTFVCQ